MLKTRHTFYIFVLFCLIGEMVHAQNSNETAITGSQLDALVNSITMVHQQMKVLSANFTQEKSSALFTEKVVQKGKLCYEAPSKLRWEYQTPKAAILLINDGKASIITNKGTISNKMLNELGNMIINTLNGNNLKDNKKFDIKFYKDKQKGNYIAELKPLDKKLQASYSSIRVIMNGKNYLAENVILNESNGDVTTISFSSMRTNVTFPEGTFNK